MLSFIWEHAYRVDLFFLSFSSSSSVVELVFLGWVFRETCRVSVSLRFFRTLLDDPFSRDVLDASRLIFRRAESLISELVFLRSRKLVPLLFELESLLVVGALD